MPTTETWGQATPLAAMLGYIQNRVEHLQVRQADVATLARQTMFDLLDWASEISISEA